MEDAHLDGVVMAPEVDTRLDSHGIPSGTFERDANRSAV
jgi:hypothetical protein